MKKTPSFVCSTRFYAQEYFPYGLSRSGEFTREQVTLLESHGQAYQALHSRTRDPINAEERKFLAVCCGEKEATTVHEKAWVRFCLKTSEGNVITSINGTGHSRPNADLTDSAPAKLYSDLTRLI